MAIQSVVIADDEFLNRDLLTEICGRLELQVRTAKDGVQALKLLEEEPADLLLTDIRMPGMGGLRLLHKAKEKWPDLPVVMMTAFASVESAVESMRQGAYDYLMKPFGLEQVEALLLRLNERQHLVREVQVLRQEVRDRHQAREFLGQSAVMRQVFDRITKAAQTQATVLVRGESGTGKELVARALHESSPRAAGPFIKINCAALTETLLASELFGHEKGSFTGADQQRIGRFELADGGTLLLDEISEISPELQAKLLRVLEEREFERVGGSKTIRSDVRVVATTNRALEDDVREGRFREDLFYRLNVIPVELPPLRERSQDILVLLTHYLDHFTKVMGITMQLSKDAEQIFLNYTWPGNVRELVNAVERLVVLADPGKVDRDALCACLPELRRQPMLADRPASTTELEAVAAAQPGGDISLAELERQHILATLDRHDGDKQVTADSLGISVRTLWNRIAKYQKAG